MAKEQATEPDIWVQFNSVPLKLFTESDNPIGMGIGIEEDKKVIMRVRYDAESDEVVMESLM